MFSIQHHENVEVENGGSYNTYLITDTNIVYLALHCSVSCTIKDRYETIMIIRDCFDPK